jgi:putative transcriptional regulator
LQESYPLDELTHYIRDIAARKIIGDVILSEESGKAFKKWRTIFQVAQKDLSERMGVSPSVLSDYERGRRRNPGTKFMRTFVESLLNIDIERGGAKLAELSRMELPPPGVILSMRELSIPVKIGTLFQVTNSLQLIGPSSPEDSIFGYTAIDSVKAILYFKGDEFIRLFGATAKRALIFTNVTHGRSPLVAIRVFPFKPSAMIIHGPAELDPIALEIAKRENIPLGLSKMPSSEDLLKTLGDLEIVEKASPKAEPTADKG